MTDGTATPVTGTAFITRIGRSVAFYCDIITFTSTAAGSPYFVFSTGNNIPTRFAPTTQQWGTAEIYNGSSQIHGAYSADPAGYLELLINTGSSTGSFTASGTKGTARGFIATWNIR
jgi:hypothetical protein